MKNFNMIFAYYSYFYFRTTDKRGIVGDFLKELAAMLKAFAILTALLANTVFASSLAEPSALCEVIEVEVSNNFYKHYSHGVRRPPIFVEIYQWWKGSSKF